MTPTDAPVGTIAATLAFTVGVPASASEPELAGTLDSIRASADAAGGAYEIIVAVNGPEDPAPALVGARAFADAAALPLVEMDALVQPVALPLVQPAAVPLVQIDARDADVAHCDAAHGRTPVVRVLRLAVRSKVAAWNAIRASARAPIVVFTDADVRLAPDAIRLLLARLAAAPALAAAAGREVAVLAPGDGLVARLAALPHRFDFGNVPGRLYALRSAALGEPIPSHVLHEDAYLSVRLGRARFTRVEGALVYLRPPTRWREYLRQRVRNELGKLQLAAEFPDLLRAHGFGVYPWRAFLRGIRAREYPLVVLSLATRLYARARARCESRRGFARGWVALPSTKRWTGGDPAAAGAQRR
ncbi:MAG: glycosyltransferase [Deltaproteobacteria bacterium]|nr:glycosyltransferase [Deltaproteobacteria bacterium]